MTATVSAYIERIPMDTGFEVVESDFDVPPTDEMVSLYHSLIGNIG